MPPPTDRPNRFTLALVAMTDQDSGPAGTLFQASGCRFKRNSRHARWIGIAVGKCELLMELFRSSVHVGTCRELERFYAVILNEQFVDYWCAS